MTAPFGPALEAALKESVQGGTFTMNSGPVVNPRFFCCISGTSVGVPKDPVAMVIPTATVVCAGAAISIDYSQSWSPSSTINTIAVTWGDGQTSAPAWPGAGTVAHPLGGYVLPGTYTITLAMTDLIGATGVDTVEITVIDCTLAPGMAMYAGCGSSGVWYTDNGGLTWEDAGGDSLGQPLIYDIKANWFTIGLEEVELWAATENGLYKGTGVGTDIAWKLIDMPNPIAPQPAPTIVTVFPSKVDSNEIYVLGTRIGNTGLWLFRSIDGGETWPTGFTTPLTGGWANVGGAAMVGDIVRAIATDERYVYAGGDFTVAGDGAPGDYIARWDTVNEVWAAMGNLNNFVRAIVIDPDDGTIYAGGSFTFDGANPVNFVARWTGLAWAALGVGMNGPVNSLAFALDGTLYAGGGFTMAGGGAVDYCASWNGAAWAAIGGAGNGPDVDVDAVAFDSQGRLYVAGDFFNVGVTAAIGIALFDTDNVWKALNNGIAGSGHALAIDDNDDVYVGGDFNWVDAGAVTASKIAKWVGTGADGDWEVVGDGFDDAVNVLVIDPLTGILYAGGDFQDNFSNTKAFNGIAMWTEAFDWSDDWSQLGSGTNVDVNGAAILEGTNTLFIGGNFTSAGGEAVDGVAQWGTTILGAALRLPTVGYTNLMDMDANGSFIYVAALTGVAQEPIIVRVPYDAFGGAIVSYLPYDGTWAGVACDWYNPNRVWIYGDFGAGDKVNVSDDWGVNWTNVDDGAWGAGEVVRPLLISIYDANDISAILSVALRAWHTGDTGTNWVNQGAIDFAAACGARDWIWDTYILIGRAAAGAAHLEWSPFLGQSWFERSTGITPLAPITSIQIVG